MDGASVGTFAAAGDGASPVGWAEDGYPVGYPVVVYSVVATVGYAVGVASVGDLF